MYKILSLVYIIRGEIAEPGLVFTYIVGVEYKLISLVDRDIIYCFFLNV